MARRPPAAVVTNKRCLALGQCPCWGGSGQVTRHPAMDSRDSLPAASSGVFLGYQRHKCPKLKLISAFSNILVWPEMPEQPSLRSKHKEHSHSFRALPANKTSSPRVGAETGVRHATQLFLSLFSIKCCSISGHLGTTARSTLSVSPAQPSQPSPAQPSPASPAQPSLVCGRSVSAESSPESHTAGGRDMATCRH